MLPQIEAIRDAEALDLHSVVTENAEKAPQKLRQIGLNYDIAHAKGVVELSDEQVKEEEKKRREAAEKKKEEEKERAEFEAWKKAKADAKSDSNKPDITDTTPSAAKAADTTDPTSTVDKPEPAPTNTSTDTTPAPETTKPDKPPTAPSTTNAIPMRPDSPTSQAQRDRTPPHSATKGEPGVVGKDSPDAEEKRKPDAEKKAKEEEEEKPASAAATETPAAEPKDAETKPDPEAHAKQWNAVCVLGLRVYSLDKEVVVRLVRPGSGEGGGLVGNKE